MKKKRSAIISNYIKLCKKLGRAVKMTDLTAIGVTKDTIVYYFASLNGLDAAARIAHPKKFKDVKVDTLYSNKEFEVLKSNLCKVKRFFITTAVVGCEVDVDFLSSIKNYCAKKDAQLLILLSADPASHAGLTVDKRLAKENIIFHDVSLNSNLFLSTIKLSAKHIDPITGLGRIGQRNGSFIFASPKQRLKMVPTGNEKLPHSLMTTGAITLPNYHTARYMSERTAYIADNDHVMGGLIVEIQDSKHYHYRQVQADDKGHFIDLGVKYAADFIEPCSPEALIPGDWHSGETDPAVRRVLFEAIKLMKPKRVVLHDAFNGLSINHHEIGNKILLAQRHNRDQLELESEMLGLAKDINDLTEEVEQVVVVKSNHDEFLNKHYLAKCKYVDDPHNHRFSLKLASAMFDGQDPLKYGVELCGLRNKERVIWLKRDEDFKIAAVQLAAHGDQGSNGKRGSLVEMESAYGNSVTGHSHTPGILRRAWAVGTSSYLRLSYNSGPSSWLQTFCLVYPNGARQLINVIKGKWKL